MPNFVSYSPGVVKSDKRRGFFLASWQRDMSFLDGAVPKLHHTHAWNSEKPRSPPVRGFFISEPSDTRVTLAQVLPW